MIFSTLLNVILTPAFTWLEVSGVVRPSLGHPAVELKLTRMGEKVNYTLNIERWRAKSPVSIQSCVPSGRKEQYDEQSQRVSLPLPPSRRAVRTQH